MSDNKTQLRKEREWCTKWGAYHRSMAAKCFEERRIVDSAFHVACARLHERHAAGVGALLVVIDLVEGARQHDDG